MCCLNMSCRWLVIAVLLAATAWGQEPAPQDKQVAYQQLLSKIKAYRTHWSEGYIDVHYESVFGVADVKVWWAGDRSRRHVTFYGLDGKSPPKSMVLIYSPQTTCNYNESLLLATCETRLNKSTIPQSSYVCPTEDFLDMGGGETIEQFLKQMLFGLGPPVQAQVIETEHGYELVVSAKPDFFRSYVSADEQGRENLRQIKEGGGVVYRFNQKGLLLNSMQVGASFEGKSLVYRYQWEDDKDGSPKRLERRWCRSGQPFVEGELGWKIEVREVKRGLPKDAPSLSVPPKDLAFGTKITNRLKSPTVIEYVGGLDGEAHHRLTQSAKQLKLTNPPQPGE